MVRIEPPDPELSARLYDAVGGPWQWTDRLGWDVDRWRAHLERGEVETWLGRLGDEPVGYAELVRTGGDVEIASFGLLPGFPGRGLGGALLAAVTGGRVGARRRAGLAAHVLARLPRRAALLRAPRLPPLRRGDGVSPRWVVDASNVIGSRPDGWWRDRAGAARRLVEPLDRFAERPATR